MEDIRIKNNSKRFNIVFGILVLICSFLVVKLNELALVDRVYGFDETRQLLDLFMAIYIISIIYRIGKKKFNHLNFNLFVSILGFVYSASFIYFYRINYTNGAIGFFTIADFILFFVLIIYFLGLKLGYKGLVNRG